MSLLKFLSVFKISDRSLNPQLDRARRRHDRLPTTQSDKFYNLAKNDFKQAQTIARQRYYQLGQMLRAVIEEHYSLAEQYVISSIITRAIDRLASKVRIFPDIDFENIWYTDYYDLITLARDMGFGDETLPHWAEEPNYDNRYLELNLSDLVQILLGFAEEALLEEYQPGADIDKWLEYVFKEALKSRKRLARNLQRQNATLWLSNRTLGMDNWDRN